MSLKVSAYIRQKNVRCREQPSEVLGRRPHPPELGRVPYDATESLAPRQI